LIDLEILREKCGKVNSKTRTDNPSKFSGRLRVITILSTMLSLESNTSSSSSLSLSVGSGRTRLADVNLDLDPNCNPDVVASATHLPFRNDVFDLVLFTDVIEHLPRGEERNALKEIVRVLRRHGKIVLSCPNNIPLFTFLDPAFWVKKS